MLLFVGRAHDVPAVALSKHEYRWLWPNMAVGAECGQLVAKTVLLMNNLSRRTWETRETMTQGSETRMLYCSNNNSRIGANSMCMATSFNLISPVIIKLYIKNH